MKYRGKQTMRCVEIPNEERHWQPHLVCFNKHLRDCIKDNCAADIGARLNNYSVFLSFPASFMLQRGYRDNRFPNIYWDATYGIVLAYKHLVNGREEYREIACVGFEIDRSIIHIKQIQGARYRHEELSPLRWEKLLIKVVIEIAQRLGFITVEILPAERNDYYIPSDHELESRHISKKDWQQLLKLRYDVVAKRLGFKWDPQKRVYEYSLKKSGGQP